MLLLSSLLSFVVMLNLAVKDGLDVILIWTLYEKKDGSYKGLDSVKAGKTFYCVRKDVKWFL